MLDKNKLKGMKQVDRIMYWFQNVKPELSPLESWQHLGIYRLQARIHELKKIHNIETERKAVKNQFDDSCRVANYVYHKE